MTMTRGRVVALGGLSLYIFVFGFACGAVNDRIRADRERTIVLQRYDEAVQQWHAFLITVERRAESQAIDGTSDQEVR
jgi:hypothetical protein